MRQHNHGKRLDSTEFLMHGEPRRNYKAGRMPYTRTDRIRSRNRSKMSSSHCSHSDKAAAGTWAGH